MKKLLTFNLTQTNSKSSREVQKMSKSCFSHISHIYSNRKWIFTDVLLLPTSVMKSIRSLFDLRWIRLKLHQLIKTYLIIISLISFKHYFLTVYPEHI